MQRVEQTGVEDDLDVILSCQWIAFNALYGQWDDRTREPRPDRECWRQFLDRVIDLDADGQIEATLVERKKLAMAILDDAYLGKYFWHDPSARRAQQTTSARRQAATWHIEKRWGLILEQVVERIYLLRCQLPHGATTHGSRLNRTSMRRCSIMLGHLLSATLLVFIDHGADEQWGPLCFPPIA